MGLIASRLMRAVEYICMCMYTRATTNLFSTRLERVYTIKCIPGKGKGLVATVDIRKGTRIICESPVLISDQRVPNLPAYIKQLGIDLYQQASALPVYQQREIGSMLNIHPYNDTAEMYRGIMRTNALPCGPDLSNAGLFLQACRINHACNANSQNFWNENIKKLTVHAVRDIKKDQEITISYLSCVRSRQARQQELYQNFKFTCDCSLCSLPPGQSRDNDVKLERVCEIDNIIEEAGVQGLVSPARRMLGYVDEAVRLWDGHAIGLARAYPDALQIAVANGDLARATVFAHRALQLYLIAMGDDSPDVVEYAGLAQNPTMHPFYGMSMQWYTDLDDVPKGLRREEFDNWLWKRNGKSVRKKYLKSEEHCSNEYTSCWTSIQD